MGIMLGAIGIIIGSNLLGEKLKSNEEEVKSISKEYAQFKKINKLSKEYAKV